MRREERWVMSEKGVAAVKEFEGYRAEAYQCAAGVWTIGWGHTDGVKRGDRVSRAEAERLLRVDLMVAEDVANGTAGIRTQGQFDAVVDFVFNCGAGNFEKSTLKRCIERGECDERIQAEFMRWAYAGGRRLEGLVRRRAWEAERWRE